jgi:LacI family transcriptional regulator
MLHEQRVAGIVMAPASGDVAAANLEIRQLGTPIVLFEHAGTDPNQCCISVDDVKGGRVAARHLREQGHTRIALINGPRDIAPCADRATGFMAALETDGIELSPQNQINLDAMTIAGGEEACARLLVSDEPPTAIFCTNDLMALGAEHAVLTAGRRIPDDVALVGYDDVAFASMAYVPLTTIRQPAYELGYQAATLLLDEITNAEHRHSQMTFTPTLVARASTLGTSAAMAHSEGRRIASL